ncbi:MAG: hypothetical protein GXY08_08595, partial [Ruminococcus sp.]|nr:hypothetical protein [Ruminococcus sp.]
MFPIHGERITSSLKTGANREKTFAADASDISSSNNDDKPDIGNELSEIANACGKTLLGAAREVGDAAKSAAGSVVEYAKSDEAKEKINAVKDKAKFIAAVADCAVTDIKEKTSDKINEFRQSRAGKAVTGNNVSGDGIDDINSEEKNNGSEYQEIPYIPTEPVSEAAVINDTEIKNEAVSLENVSYEEHTDIVVSPPNESRQDNITPV